MKNLNKYILESLLDDEEDLINDDSVLKEYLFKFLTNPENGYNVQFTQSEEILGYDIDFDKITLNDYTKNNITFKELMYLDINSKVSKKMKNKWDLFPKIKDLTSLQIFIDDNFEKLDLTDLRADDIGHITIGFDCKKIPSNLDKNIILPHKLNKFSHIYVKSMIHYPNKRIYPDFDYTKLKNLDTFGLRIDNELLNILDIQEFKVSLIKEDRTTKILNYIFNNNKFDHISISIYRNGRDESYWIDKAKTGLGYKLKKIR